MSTIISQRQMDLRKAPRKRLHYPAWIDVGNGATPLDCMIYDISETGARLTLASTEQAPDRFVLLLSIDGNTKRNCEISLRSGFNVGVKFLRGPASIILDC